MQSTAHPEQGYRSCLGILRLSTKYSPARLEAAAGRALRFGVLRYKGVKNILEARLDAIPPDDEPPSSQAGDEHVRGSDYYH
jgi:hypothetical protein